MSLPLDRYPVIRASNFLEIREKLRTLLDIEHIDVQSKSEPLVAHINHLQMATLGLTYCSYSAPVVLTVRETPNIQQVFSIDGAGHVTAGGLDEEIGREGTSSVIPPLVPANFEYRAGSSHIVLRIKHRSLLDQLGVLLGDQVDRPLVFSDISQSLRAAVGALRHRIFNFANEMNLHGQFLSEPVLAEIERMVLVAFLICNRSNYTPLLMRDPQTANRTVVQRVEGYIEANWDKAIDTATLAEMAGISARSLFRHFRQERGYSPFEFARRIRLQRAFEALTYPDKSTSVVQVALRCGFQNVGHFARDYRLAFGERPSETLARATQK